MAWLVISLYFGGLLLVFAEIFVPGGVCGLIGALSMLASCIIGCVMFPQYALFIIVGQLVIATIAVVLGFKVFPMTPVGKAIALKHNLDANMGYVAAESDTSLLGAIGVVYSPLRPVGSIIINDKRVQAVSEGRIIDKGARVRVTQVHGNRIVVEEVKDA